MLGRHKSGVPLHYLYVGCGRETFIYWVTPAEEKTLSAFFVVEWTGVFFYLQMKRFLKRLEKRVTYTNDSPKDYI